MDATHRAGSTRMSGLHGATRMSRINAAITAIFGALAGAAAGLPYVSASGLGWAALMPLTLTVAVGALVAMGIMIGLRALALAVPEALDEAHRSGSGTASSGVGASPPVGTLATARPGSVGEADARAIRTERARWAGKLGARQPVPHRRSEAPAAMSRP